MTDKKYSRSDMIISGGIGYVLGSIEGFIGGLIIPSSLRSMNDDLDDNIDSIFKEEKSMADRIGELTYHATRIPTRIVGHGTMLYKAVEELVDDNHSKGIPYSLILIPNVISLGYELYRARKKSAEKKEI